MSVMGCGDQGLSCDFVAEPNKTWNSQAACERAIPAELMKNKNANYPVITASCDARIMASLPQTEAAAEAQKPKSNYEIIREEIGVDEEKNRNNETMAFYRLKDGYALVRDETAEVLTKINEATHRSYKKFEGAVKLSLKAISDITNPKVSKLDDTSTQYD